MYPLSLVNLPLNKSNLIPPVFINTYLFSYSSSSGELNRGLEKVSEIIRKDRSVGIVPLPDKHIPREDLEEIVLNVSNILQYSDCAARIYFCAFNGGSDVWVDIGDKRYGVLSLQKYLGDIKNMQTLHVGDQFASIGANDFKARLVASTIWVCCPRETSDMLEEFFGYLDEHKLNRISLLTR
ncbi:hypothetical protein FF38_01257 [Lucilia cuprina]|uniref:IMP-specific 5'-nucleotidase 1 n=1 Tax=Lucilia cuprina TaxID=7375 RepID=A0A0L0BQ24_LUCCU|nr:hypothetical protein FF38_01257 [Lucilia cuprina]